ncbi:MAG TPA: hypothetical protein VGF29_06900 [Hyphomicrobiaceae bacterium]|jgi:hypothetical protein
MEARTAYTAAVGATAVTLTKQAGAESDTPAGIFGTGTIVITTGGAPDPGFWHVGKYLVTITRL